MKRYKSALLAMVAVFVLSMGWSQPAEAQAFLGNYCWKLDPFIDALRVAVTQYPNGIYGITVRWRAGASYQFMGSGGVSANPSNPGTLQMAFSSTGNTGNLSCDFQADLSASTLSGPWSFQCPSSGFTNSGTLTYRTPCPADASPSEGDTGKTAMDSAQSK